MNKKQAHKKQEPSQKVARINAELERGNYSGARQLSHRLLAATDAPAMETDFARLALKIAWPDPVALLVGFLCLIFSVGALFLSAY